MSAIEDLYRTHAADIRRFALWLCGDPAEADDILSETFVRAWAGADGIRAATARAYLFTIARNLYLQRRRRRAREQRIDGRLVDPGPDALRRVEDTEQLDRILHAMIDLPESDRSALWMRVEGEMSYQEIAQALGISVAAARVKVCRSRIRLAELRDR
jgi:RNA polymerase sigma-70 factor, ECF subfamily